MKNVKRYSKLYWVFAKNHLKVMMEYRIDFLIGILSVMLQQFAGIFFVKIVFDQIHDLNGWSFYEVLFVYGIAASGRAIHQIFFDNLWTLGWQYIQTGQLDRILIRPVNTLFHICAERLQQDGFGQFILGSMILWTCIPHVKIEWGIPQVIMLFIMIVSSGAIYVALNLFLAALSFWMVDSLPVMSAIFGLSEFAKYPLTIYNRGIQIILTWVIPYAFTAFYPAAYLLGKEGYTLYSIITPIAAILCCTLALLFWKKGLKAYTSTGS